MNMNTQAQATFTPEIKIQNVITLTARLAQVMAEEVDHLKAMKIKSIEALQEEKIYLTNALEAHRKLIDKHPYLVDTIPSQDKEDLRRVVEVFNNILAENHRKLLLAREVNHKIVSSIKEVVQEQTMSKVYSGGGVTHTAPYEILSITLDKMV